MEIVETKIGDVVVLVPDGNLTVPADCQVLDHKLKALLDSKASRIVVDGIKVGQIGSGAMRALLLVTHKLAKLGGRLVLCSLNERVRQAFKISGFDNDFAIVSTQERAVALAQEALSAAEASPATSAPSAKKDIAWERRMAALARVLVAGLTKASRTPAPEAPGSLDSIRDLASSLLERGSAPSRG